MARTIYVRWNADDPDVQGWTWLDDLSHDSGTIDARYTYAGVDFDADAIPNPPANDVQARRLCQAAWIEAGEPPHTGVQIYRGDMPTWSWNSETNEVTP